MLDIVQRYAPIVNAIKKAQLKEKEIVEIGGTGQGVGWYLPDYQIIDCDIEFLDQILPNTKPIKTSGEKIPLPDGSVEIVVSVDTLEHLPTRSKQKRMIKEMLRVSQSQVILGVPTGQESWETVKRFSKMFYQKHPGQKYQYLEEHLRYGHPKREEILEMIKVSGFKTKVTTEQNTNNQFWLLFQKIYLSFPRLWHLLRYRRLWYLLLNPVFPLFSRGPCLRTIFFIQKKASS